MKPVELLPASNRFLAVSTEEFHEPTLPAVEKLEVKALANAFPAAS